MILVVCLNPALDITHHVERVDWAGVNRPTAVYSRPGGKGTNVARNLHSFGIEVLLTGLVGGTTGNAVGAGLRRLGVPAAFAAVGGETRRTFSVVDGSGAVALFNEPGPQVSAAEFKRFRADFGAALAGASVVVLSGSLPPGLPSAAYAELIAAAAAAGVPAVLDTSGEPLREGVAAGPAIVKPNIDELAVLAGRSLRTADGEISLTAVAAAAAELRAAGARAVVVSLGPDGLLAVTEEGCWLARPPAVTAGNATGAGDAATAALARGLLLGQPWPMRLVHAAALGAATVAAPVAGEFSHADYENGVALVTVERLAVTADCPVTDCQAREQAVGAPVEGDR
jgi:tagatose 6-phosphate kinase